MKHGEDSKAWYGYNVVLAACLLGTIAISWWGKVEQSQITEKRAAVLVKELIQSEKFDVEDLHERGSL